MAHHATHPPGTSSCYKPRPHSLGGPTMHDADLAKEALAELPADIGDSPLFNGDLAPVPKGRRNWNTYNFAALWISMAH